MKKKIFTYMMTAIFMLGCAGLSTPITAYATEGYGSGYYGTGYDFSTGEHFEINVPPMTRDEAIASKIRRYQQMGLSEAQIQTKLQEQGLASPSTASSTATPAPAETKPAYTQAEIDAAWQETGRTASTCTENGVITYKNSLTGKTKTEKLDLVAHTYELSNHEDATCIAEGVDTYTCTVCGNSYTETTPVIDHVYELTHEDATCTHEGIDTFTCSVCGDTYSETIPMKEHTPGEATVTKKAKLFAEGENTVFCTECNTALSTETIPQICPLSLKAVLEIAGISLLALAGIVAAIVLRNNKRKESDIIETDEDINETVAEN